MLSMLPPGVRRERNRLFVDREDDAADFASDAAGSSRRIDHEGARFHLAVLIALGPREYEDMLIAGVLMQADLPGLAKSGVKDFA